MPGQHDQHIAVPGNWATNAACRGQGDLFLLPPERGAINSLATRNRINRARTICNTCPVLELCRDWATSDPDPAAGMLAAGLTPKERRLQRR